MDYYAALGVAPTASIDEIERAYRALARKVHPDRNIEDAARADERMKQLNLIRETLTDPLLRAAYDDRLRRERPEQKPRPRPANAERREDRPPAAPTPRQPSPAYAPYIPHPHVAPFLRTQAEIQMARAAPPTRDLRPVLILATVIAAIIVTVAVMWPDEPLPAVTLEPTPPLPPRPPKKETVVVVRGDSQAVRRAVRKNARVVPVGATFDEVIRKFGPPDRVESSARAGDLILVYGEGRVEMHDGKVVSGARPSGSP